MHRHKSGRPIHPRIYEVEAHASLACATTLLAVVAMRHALIALQVPLSACQTSRAHSLRLVRSIAIFLAIARTHRIVLAFCPWPNSSCSLFGGDPRSRPRPRWVEGLLPRMTGDRLGKLEVICTGCLVRGSRRDCITVVCDIRGRAQTRLRIRSLVKY